MADRVGAGLLWDDPDFQFKPARLKIGTEGLGGWVAATGQPLLVLDVRQDSRYVWMEGSATRSELIVPILVKEIVIGVLDAVASGWMLSTRPTWQSFNPWPIKPVQPLRTPGFSALSSAGRNNSG